MDNHDGQANKLGWKEIEEIVAILEKSLSPFAKVEHNVRMPVLGKKRCRQCDIVVTFGESPRQTITIVEVQKRLRKPDITTFHGWYRKMQEVGAQNLICVSVKGYPKSIIDEVAIEYGPTVKLLTLHELQELKIGALNFIFPFVIHQHPNFTLKSAGPNIKLYNPSKVSNVEFNSNDKLFSIEQRDQLSSLNELLSNFITQDLEKVLRRKCLEIPDSGIMEIELGSIEIDLWLHNEGEKYKVKSLPVRVEIETISTKIPLSIFSYNQEFMDGELAWITIAKGIVDNKEIKIEIVFRPDKEGYLHISSWSTIGVEKLGFIFSEEKATLENHLSRNTPIKL